MTKKQIIKNIEKDKEIQNNLKKLKYRTGEDIEYFYDNAIRYLKAVKEERLMCIIDKVSSSGMSRTMKFLEMQKSNTGNKHFILNFYLFFILTGHTKAKDSDYFRIGGCGMDMVFATHYNIIHHLERLGFITKIECDTFAQKTPHTL